MTAHVPIKPRSQPSLPRVSCLETEADADMADLRAGRLVSAFAAKQEWARAVKAPNATPRPRIRQRISSANGHATNSASVLPPPPELITGDEWHPLSGLPPPEIIPTTWTGWHVGKRLIEAYTTLAQLQFGGEPREWGNSWPEWQRDWSDQLAAMTADVEDRELAAEEQNYVHLLPTAKEISRMEAAIGWGARYLAGSQHNLARITQFVARWRSADRELTWIAHKLHLAPATVRERNRAGLDLIALGLRRDRVAVFSICPCHAFGRPKAIPCGLVLLDGLLHMRSCWPAFTVALPTLPCT